MSDWRPEHAAQVLTAYDVLRAGRGDLAPADLLYQRWYAVRPPHVATRGRWDPPVATTARAAHGGAHDWAGDDCEVLATGIAGVVVVGTPTGATRAVPRGVRHDERSPRLPAASRRPGAPGGPGRCGRAGRVVADVGGGVGHAAPAGTPGPRLPAARARGGGRPRQRRDERAPDP